MSQRGLHLAASVFQALQQGRYKLIQMGRKNARTRPLDRQDVLLGQLLGDMEKFGSKRFTRSHVSAIGWSS